MEARELIRLVLNKVTVPKKLAAQAVDSKPPSEY